MKAVLSLIVVLAPSFARAAACESQTAALTKLTGRFLTFHPERKTDYAVGTDREQNDVEGFTSKFLKRGKTDACREDAFRALVTLYIASSPFDQESTGPEKAESMLNDEPALRPAFKQAIADYAKLAGGSHELICRARDFEGLVKANHCNRVTPKANCYAKGNDHGSCDDLPEAGSR